MEDLRERSVTPHNAIGRHLSKTGKPRAIAIDRRTTRHPGYAVSQCRRKRIEEVFGWAKGSAGLAKVKLRGRAKVDAVFTLALAAYNLAVCPSSLERQHKPQGQMAHHHDARPRGRLSRHGRASLYPVQG